MDPLFEIELQRPAPGSRDAGRTLYRQLKEAIEDGRLAVGAKLPASRMGADLFGVSRNTVAEIYDRLLNDGYVTARQGSGTYVAARRATAPARTGGSAYPLNPVWLAEETVAAMGFWRDEAADSAPGLDFRPALIDSRLFPYPIYRRVSAKQLRGLEQKPPSYKSPQGNQGNFHLRQAITTHIALTRAVACRPEDVVVTSGAQQAFDLLARPPAPSWFRYRSMRRGWWSKRCRPRRGSSA
jgi:GntR family transcriptional regulator/MocR family aminotransferase